MNWYVSNLNALGYGMMPLSVNRVRNVHSPVLLQRVDFCDLGSRNS